MSEQYVLRLRQGDRFGWWVALACEYPDNSDIGWEEGPTRWRWTRKGAERYGRRRMRAHVRADRRQEFTVPLERPA